jgi:hypothetical protein
MTRQRGILRALFLAVSMVLSTAACKAQPPRASSSDLPPTKTQLTDAYGRLPLHFEENQGQTDPAVRFTARTGGGRVLIGADGLELGIDGTPVRLSFAGGARDGVISGFEPLLGRVNYYVGDDPARWRTNIPTFARVRYAGVYPGIDVVVYGNQRQLEYDFVVAPGADPRAIRVQIAGADSVAVDAAGDVSIRRGGRTIVQRSPVVYQERDGRRELVAARHRLESSNAIAFDVGTYDRSRPLVIDPVVVYSARIGVGTARAIAVDSAGYAYFAGENTGAFADEYPMVNAAFPGRNGGREEIFVTRLSPNGSTLIYSTYIAASLFSDFVNAIATDGAGNAYITGRTHGGYPTTAGAFQTTAAGPGEDASVSFVTKLSPAGALVYSTLLQGTTFDGDAIRGGVCYQGAGNGIAADAAGNAYVVGFTSTNNFPTTPGAFIPTKPTTVPPGATCGPASSGYLTKLSPSGSSLVYSTYLDGNGVGLSVALDGAGNAYVGGIATPPPGTITANLAPGGAANTYVAKFNASGFPTQTTIIGVAPESIDVGAGGSIYVTGDNFVGRMNAGGTAWLWSTTLPGTFTSIAGASDGSAWVAGSTDSASFPTKDPLRVKAQPTEAVTVKFSPTGALLFSSPLGAGHAYGVALDGAGGVYLTGDAGPDFLPTTSGAYSRPPSGGADVFVLKLSDTTPPPTPTDAKPTVTITSPSGSVWTGNSIAVAASATDDVGLQNIKLWGNGAVFGTIACSGKTCNGTVTWLTGPLPPAAYEVNAVATDSAGQQTMSAKVTIFKDATSPVKPSGATASGGGGGTAPPPLTATITSPANGATVSGNVTVSIAAGNSGPSPLFELKVDNTNVLFSGAPGGTTQSTPWSTGAFANGTHTLNLKITDGARTATATATVTVNNPTGGGVDTTKPTVSITSPTGNVWTGNSINISASASDNVKLASIKLWGNGAVFATFPCSAATCSGTVTWVTGSLPPAAYEVNAVATDAAGNQTVSGKVTIFKDATSPVKPSGATPTGGGSTPPPLGAAITSPASGSTVSGTVSVSMTASNAQATPTFTLKVDNGATIPSTASGSTATAGWNTTGVANGTHTLNLTVSDGTRTSTATISVTVNNTTGGGGGGDTTAPAVSITSPPNGAWTGNSIDVTATATDNVALASLKFFGNGTQFAQAACSGTTCTSTQWWLTGSLPSGQHTITVVATDTAGNTKTSAPVVINK